MSISSCFDSIFSHRLLSLSTTLTHVIRLTSNNLLYPKEDKINHVLMYACRNCDFKQETRNPCVYKHDLLVVSKETAGVTQDLHTDPTLPRSNIECPRCHHKEAVFFQGQAKRTDTKMVLFFVCTNCSKTFQDPVLANR